MKKILLAGILSLMVSTSVYSSQSEIEDAAPDPVAPVPSEVTEINVPITCGPAEDVIKKVKSSWGSEILFMTFTSDKTSLTEMFFDPRGLSWAIVTLKKLNDEPKACIISHGNGITFNPLYRDLLKPSSGI